MDEDRARDYGAAVVAAVTPHIRAAAHTWARAGIEAPAPEDLAQVIVARWQTRLSTP